MQPARKRGSRITQQFGIGARPCRPGQAIRGLLCRTLSAEGRKSVEPLAAVTAPERTAAQHQSLLHFVAQAPWSDQAMLRRVREHVLPSITRDEPIQAWIIDNTAGFPKKGATPWA